MTPTELPMRALWQGQEHCQSFSIHQSLSKSMRHGNQSLMQMCMTSGRVLLLDLMCTDICRCGGLVQGSVRPALLWVGASRPPSCSSHMSSLSPRSPSCLSQLLIPSSSCLPGRYAAPEHRLVGPCVTVMTQSHFVQGNIKPCSLSDVRTVNVLLGFVAANHCCLP